MQKALCGAQHKPVFYGASDDTGNETRCMDGPDTRNIKVFKADYCPKADGKPGAGE